MLNLILITLLINAILNYIFNVKITTLSCGNFAWIGSKPELFNLDKYKILGLYNVERGRHSCGIAVDGEIEKGIHLTAEFDKFITEKAINIPVTTPIVIGHTRQSSVGVKNLQNTHPFKFNRENGSYFIGSHNGTLTNHNDLADKYNIDITSRNKIDSEILLEIISKYDIDVNTNIKVLSEYEGGAALVFYDSEDPNILYVFRGKSKNKGSYNTYGNYDTYGSYNTYNTYSNYNSVASEERPLFYWQESNESMYISSLKDSLLAISNVDVNNIHSFSANVLYKIENGSIVNQYTIDRINSKKYEKKSKIINNDKNIFKSNNTKNNTNVNSLIKLQEKSIFYENIGDIINTTLNNNIIFERFRFRRNGHNVINGCYVYIEDYGLEFVDIDPIKAKKQLKDFKFYDPSTKQTVNLKDQSKATLLYIVDGLLIPNILEFTSLMSIDSHLHAYRNNTVKLSHLSRYPVIENYSNSELKSKKKTILVNNANSFTNLIKYKGSSYTGIIKPICSNKTYIIKNGKVTDTTISIHLNSVPNDIVQISLDSLYEQNDDTFEKDISNNIKNNVKNNELYELIIEAFDYITNLIDIGVMLSNYPEDDIAKSMFSLIQDIESNCEPIKKYINLNEQ